MRASEVCVAIPSWLVSYPKSGVTWVRFLLADLMGVPAASSAELRRRVPCIHDPNEHWAAHLETPGWLCTHKTEAAHVERYGRTMPRLVHLVRHPADALLSEARYHCLTRAAAVLREEGSVDAERLEAVLREHLDEVLAQGKVAQHDRAGMGTWAEHTVSWRARHVAQPTVFLRYEDLVRAPEAQISRLADFLELRTVDVSALAARYTLARMRALQEVEIAEQTRGMFYLGPEHQVAYDLGLRFVGRGRIGEGLQLGTTARARLDEHFGPVMAALGYTTDPHQPVVEAHSALAGAAG